MELYQNPIQKQGDFADPFVLRYNGTYYLYCTNPDTRCWSSQDLLHWKLEGPTVPAEEFPELVPFAPEVVYWNGAFYMYTSPHGFGHYVLKSDSPTGPFRKITGNVGHAIDFSVFIDDNGQWYAYWADDRGILGCEMASPTEFGEPVLIGADLHGWTEGPFVLKREGKYHLTYTGNHFLSKGYRIHAAVADRPLGLFRDHGYNPVILRTEGDVVGLGHSSTVLGPDLQTHYIFYHNLNPDKTRDLNLDPVVFTPEKACVLGPTDTPRPAPALPRWQRQRPERIRVEGTFREDVVLLSAGIVEVNLAAGEKTEKYGVMLTGKTEFRLEFSRENNTLTLWNGDVSLTREALPAGYDHNALHCMRLEIGTGLTVYVDNLLRLRGEIPGAEGMGYYGDGPLYLGTATMHPAEDALSWPVPCCAPGDRDLSFQIQEGGEYQIVLLGTRHAGEIQVDHRSLLPQARDGENAVTFYRCTLSAGDHRLEAGCACAQTILLEPFCGTAEEEFSVRDLGPFDKVRGTRKSSNLHILARLEPGHRDTGWQTGVIFRASQLADGGEGADKRLGTNFFIGYRACLAEGKLQLWKHRYDETLLDEVPLDTEQTVALEILAAENRIVLSVENRVVLTWQDPEPILNGFVGFHTRNCVLARGSIRTPKPQD